MNNRSTSEYIDIIANRNNSYSQIEFENASTHLYNTLKDSCLDYILFNYCKKDTFLAEDAFQYAMFKLIEEIRKGKLNNASGLFSWILTTSRNYVLQCNDYRKNDSRNDGYGYHVYNSSDLTYRDSDSDYLENIQDKSCDNPQEYHCNQEIMRLVESALDNAGLNDKQIAVFRLYFLKSMKEKEVAKLLGMNINTVKNNILTCRNKMQRYFNNNSIDYRDYLYSPSDNKTSYRPIRSNNTLKSTENHNEYNGEPFMNSDQYEIM